MTKSPHFIIPCTDAEGSCLLSPVSFVLDVFGEDAFLPGLLWGDFGLFSRDLLFFLELPALDFNFLGDIILQVLNIIKKYKDVVGMIVYLTNAM